MNNDEAMVILVAKRAAINSAINGLNEYISQAVNSSNWTTATVKDRSMSAIKGFAKEAGADISRWDGSKAPSGGTIS